MMDKTRRPNAIFAVAVFALLAAIIFYQSWSEGQVLFSNDGPLGLLSAQADAPGTAFTGYWQDLYWLGSEQPAAFPNVTQALFFLLGPGLWGKAGAVAFAKFYAPIALVLLALATWLFCRQLGFSSWVCLLAGLGSMLNSDAFSNACWGLPSWVITRAMFFLALAALATRLGRGRGVIPMLAGFCLGVGVMEGFDLGAIFSLYAAAFGLFCLGFREGAFDAKRSGTAVLSVALMSVCAGWIAYHALLSLVGTQVKGVAGTQQDQGTREERWVFATLGSLPKIETLRVIIPGMFGYRMDTPDGGPYWGSVNRGPQIEELHAKARHGNPSEREQAQRTLEQLQGNPYAFRHSGSGEYAGLLVVLLAFWAVAQSVRGNASPYSATERRMIWFWACAGAVSLLLALGRHAPFYQLIYALPYVSTIRNPIKFMQPFHVALIILFAHGLEDLCRRYLGKRLSASSLSGSWKRWWASVSGFDRRWAIGTAAALGVAMFGVLLFILQRDGLFPYLQLTGFNADQAHEIAGFATRELLWFIVFFALSSAVVVAVLSGVLGGERAKWAGLAFGLLLVVDLSRANGPWIVYEDYKEKYRSNPVIELLRERAHEHRVAIGPNPGLPQMQSFHADVYHRLWLQHHFPYYNIQSLDMPQEPRVAEEKVEYLNAMSRNPARYWQVTNTRYLLGLTQFSTPQGMLSYVDLLNAQLDPAQRRFKVKAAFALTQEAPEKAITATTNSIGPYALIEFGGALPRAKLYANWQVQTNLQAALTELSSPEFNPEQLVLVSSPLTAPEPANATNAHPGSVEYVSYAPKHIRLKVIARVPAVLLLNDRYHPAWKVWVNAQPAELLRANHITRGIFLQPGTHEVELKFQPSIKPLYVSLSAILCGFALCGFVCLRRDGSTTSWPPAEKEPHPPESSRPRARAADRQKSSRGNDRESK